MHLGNAAITPECAMLGFAAAGLGVGASLLAAGRSCRTHSVAKVAALGTLVFAGQMINVPVLQTSSAHFIGGVLLAELLSPALCVLVMSAVLLLQAVLLGDGSLTSLGLNIVNMAIIPAGVVILLKRAIPNRHAMLSLASVGSIVLAILLIAGEVAVGRSSVQLEGWIDFLSTMIVTHVPALAIEVLLTLGIVVLWRYLEVRQPTLAQRATVAMLAAGAVMIAVSSYVSSELPDGYESAAQVAEMDWLLAEAE